MATTLPFHIKSRLPPMTGGQAGSVLVVFVLLTLLILALSYCQGVAAPHTTITDDYYYYERIARNMLAGRGSTYDGVVLTNGYHPLWLLFVAFSILLEKATGLPAQAWSLFTCACLSIGMLAIVCANLKKLTSFNLAAIVTVAAYGIFFGVMAMETSIELFCTTLFFHRLRAASLTLDWRTGMLLGLCFLSRLDALIYFLPLVGLLWAVDSTRHKIQFAVPILLVVGLYLLLNERFFGVPLPISGAAKAVKHVTSIHASTWVGVLMIGRQNQLMLFTTMLLTIRALIYSPRKIRIQILASVAGILLFFLVTSLHTDWPLLEWYLYPVALHAIFLAFLDAPAAADGKNGDLAIGIATMICALACVSLVGVRDSRLAYHQGALVEAARRLQRLFADDPRAVIAMGDRAGAVGQALPNRLIQLEGLVMDREYLETFRRAQSISDVLDRYGVDYYIATGARLESDGCYTTWEPSQAGADSFRLESHVCAPVVATFTLDGNTTVVFRLRNERNFRG
jgi:hypothetical protein